MKKFTAVVFAAVLLLSSSPVFAKKAKHHKAAATATATASAAKAEETADDSDTATGGYVADNPDAVATSKPRNLDDGVTVYEGGPARSVGAYSELSQPDYEDGGLPSSYGSLKSAIAQGGDKYLLFFEDSMGTVRVVQLSGRGDNVKWQVVSVLSRSGN